VPGEEVSRAGPRFVGRGNGEVGTAREKDGIASADGHTDGSGGCIKDESGTEAGDGKSNQHGKGLLWFVAATHTPSDPGKNHRLPAFCVLPVSHKTYLFVNY
jgi:hypothetical protein